MRSLVVGLVMLVPALALGQVVCPYGLVPVDATHCCWPGQAFSPERQTCMGVPQCPPGLSPYGETCIASQAAPQPVPQPPPPPQPQPYLPQQLPAQVMGFQAHFQSDAGEFMVSLDNGAGCRTPCDMAVAPGRHRIHVTGEANFHEDLDFPAAPSVLKVNKRKAGFVAMGRIGLALGIPAIAVGIVCFSVGTIYRAGWDSYYSSYSYNTAVTIQNAGIGLAVGGAIFTGVMAGVGFGAAGHNHVRFETGGSGELDDRPPPLRLVGIGAAPTKNGGAALGATFEF